jgi:hypothetical protein
MFNGVSTNGTSGILVQIGDGGGIETTGYDAGGIQLSNNIHISSTSGVPLRQVSASNITSGILVWSLMGANLWVASYTTGSTVSAACLAGGGNKTLSDTLTQLRITTVNGTDTFDAGSINILYE